MEQLTASCGLGLSGMIAPDNYQNITIPISQTFVFLMEQESMKFTDEANQGFVAELGKAPEGFPIYEWFLNYYLSFHNSQLKSQISMALTQNKEDYEFLQYGSWLKYTSTDIGTDVVVSIQADDDKIASMQSSILPLTTADTVEDRVNILKNTGDMGIATITTTNFDGTLSYRPNGTLYFSGQMKNS